ncbi:unnamed protein product [Rotaria magnacalcarata]|uniref:Uncharacterized protein n=1 Tax=Rotaria magnacalcarata TaxID=392030 RepID=A0A816P260_9BILA|nr:unnamed protein product [Rotaria magnacalcarata]
MASASKNSKAPNLAALLLVNRRLAAKQVIENGDNQGQLQLPATNIGAHSVEKLSYHQSVSHVNSTAIAPTNQNASPIMRRKNKQIEVELLDRNIEEINHKQEQKTNATLNTWKDFESFNYGFATESEIQQAKPMSPISQQEQRTSTPTSTTQIQPIKPIEEMVHQEPQVNQLPIEKCSSPILERSTSNNMDSPIRNQSSSKTPSKEEELRKKTADKPFPPKAINEERTSSPLHPKAINEERTSSPLPPKTIHEKPKSSPLPPKAINEERTSSPEVYAPIHSAHSLDNEKTYEHKQPQSASSKSPILMIEQTVPITSIIANPNIFQNNSQSVSKLDG